MAAPGCGCIRGNTDACEGPCSSNNLSCGLQVDIDKPLGLSLEQGKAAGGGLVVKVTRTCS